ncbi:MAG: cryptochrome/photolyase family protein [Candidatus Dependentiae bacterium]
MISKYKKSLMIFRRDLRLQDNTALNFAVKKSQEVIPCFIFDPIQVSEKNKYRSANAIQFMIESLEDLAIHFKKRDGNLYFFMGHSAQVLEKLLESEKIEAVFTNKDYTSFSLKRDQALKKICDHHNVAFEQYDDAVLNAPEVIHTQSNTPFSVFTAFFKASLHIPIRKPEALDSAARWVITHIPHSKTLESIKHHIFEQENPHLHVHGGRQNAIAILNNLQSFHDYAKIRDYPIIPTTNLSAHNKFGTVSIREVYYMIAKELGANHALIRQLYWRDFFTHVAYHSPFVFGHAFHEKYEHIMWENDEKFFKSWCNGQTGFPIVDAAMRQLNETGYMHNRTRMIVGSFLVKDLHIDWRWGEQYFARHLVDYDPAVNNGNWQWVASTGCDASPYFRIFNPWLQQEKFDKDCLYIKKWLPELKNVDPRVLHNWYKPNSPTVKGYPKPIIDHSKVIQKTKAMYQRAARGS